MLPVGVVNFSVAVTIWSVALVGSLPARSTPGRCSTAGPELWNGMYLHSAWQLRARRDRRPAAHPCRAVDHPPLRAARRRSRADPARPVGEGCADRAAAGDARPLGRRGCRRAPPDRARPARRRAAAARPARHGSRPCARQVRRGSRRAPASSSARHITRRSARSSSSASSCGDSIRPCSRTAGSTPHCRRSRPVRRCPSRSASTCPCARRRRSRRTRTSSWPRR